MVRNIKLAAAIAAVLSGGAAMAGQPSPASAAAPDVGLYIAGSSAAAGAILGVVKTTFCGNSFSSFTSTGNTNFLAVSCTPATGTLTGANGSNIFTIWYRTEGGSVTGALPLVSGSSIQQLSLAGASGSAGVYTVAVGGSSATNGIDDSFTGGVSPQPVQFGITDVEPGALIKNNYPSAYKASTYGSASSTALSNLSATTLFDQVFGIFVNTNSGAFSAAEKADQGKTLAATTGSLSLSKQTIASILQGVGTADWSAKPDSSGNAIAGSLLGITIINREQGSGSRTATDIFFTGDSCVKSQAPILESTAGTADYFSTGNVLAAANTIPGAITYASVDNAGKNANLTLVAVDGVVPTQINAASGAYGDWFELTGVTGKNFSSLSANQQALIASIISAAQTQSSGPNGVDILAIPSGSSPPSLPISGTLTNGEYVNPFTRLGISCADPTSTL